jgi:hypothetical protein
MHSERFESKLMLMLKTLELSLVVVNALELIVVLDLEKSALHFQLVVFF